MEWPNKCALATPPPCFCTRVSLQGTYPGACARVSFQDTYYARPQEYNSRALSSAPSYRPANEKRTKIRTLENEGRGTRRRGAGLANSRATPFPRLHYQAHAKNPTRETDARGTRQMLLARQLDPRTRVSILPRGSTEKMLLIYELFCAEALARMAGDLFAVRTIEPGRLASRQDGTSAPTVRDDAQRDIMIMSHRMSRMAKDLAKKRNCPIEVGGRELLDASDGFLVNAVISRARALPPGAGARCSAASCPSRIGLSRYRQLM